MSYHMPTDEVVKDAATFQSNRLGEPLGIESDIYDRWLRLVRAEAWDQGNYAGKRYPNTRPNPYRADQEGNE